MDWHFVIEMINTIRKVWSDDLTDETINAWIDWEIEKIQKMY